VDVLIFDFDGLIVDTESAIYQAWRELYESQGHDLPLSTYVQCVGSTFHSYDPVRALEELVGGEIQWPELLETKDARIRELHEEADTLPGIRELLVQARSEGIPCAVASSSARSWVAGWLERLGILEAFNFICSRDDVPRAKPAPDLFLEVLRVFGAPPHRALVLEDSYNGLKAARAAGIACVVVPNAITAESDFSGAAKVLPTLGSVRLDGLRQILTDGGNG
jgi:HAD superfamily hydrolase (TIGR01509 family)